MSYGSERATNAKAENGEPAVLYWYKMPYKLKVAHAANLVRGFYDNPEIGGACHITVGGLDSIVLTLFIRSLGYSAERVPAVSVSGLEDPSNQRVHKAIGVKSLPRGRDKDGKPWTLPRVYAEYGYPILSKDFARAMQTMRNPTEKNALTREYYSYRNEEGRERIRNDKKEWLNVFKRSDWDAGISAQFGISDRCCYLMKERPLLEYAKETSSYPFMGLMYEEGGRRAAALVNKGCNLISPTTKRSCPFASFTRDDLLTLALEMDDWYKSHWVELNPNASDRVATIVPTVYGTIEEYADASGQKHLRTTKVQRTGCIVCGFGVRVQERPHRFDQLRESNPKAWAVATRPVSDGGWGWGDVLDAFNVPWRDVPKVEEQTNLFLDIANSQRGKE